ncbi:homeobox and c2h2 transcription factor [Trichoderma arundinaceum]|uniref:Homeobox and c2h2 transcription factor n=1 Tax=Trichoderma arundinaceum TaxID=490622 RepID=A0A395NJ67_TRIAR|nr:homeobox and c2h2 transcription factor [Trichoderma arundinaceum]
MDSLAQPKDQVAFDKWDSTHIINSSTNIPYRDFDASFQIEETLLSRPLNNIVDTQASDTTRSPPLQRHSDAAALPSIKIAGSTSQLAGDWESFEQCVPLEKDGLRQYSGFYPPEPTELMDISLKTWDTCNSLSEESPSNPELRIPPKIGRRFSSRPSNILKSWLADHIHHPYPSIRDIEIMQRQTSLSRQQILTWFTNARRRLKAQARRPPTPTPLPLRMESAIETLKLGEQNLLLEEMNPLQRWQHSPPEHEPAAASAIAKAVSGLSTSNSPIGISMKDMSLLTTALSTLRGRLAVSNPATFSITEER